MISQCICISKLHIIYYVHTHAQHFFQLYINKARKKNKVIAQARYPLILNTRATFNIAGFELFLAKQLFLIILVVHEYLTIKDTNNKDKINFYFTPLFRGKK